MRTASELDSSIDGLDLKATVVPGNDGCYQLPSVVIQSLIIHVGDRVEAARSQ